MERSLFAQEMDRFAQEMDRSAQEMDLPVQESNRSARKKIVEYCRKQLVQRTEGGKGRPLATCILVASTCNSYSPFILMYSVQRLIV